MTEQIDVVTFKNILNEYLNNKLNDTIAVNIKLSVKYEDVNMGVNLEIYYLYDNNTIYLTEDDINEALKAVNKNGSNLYYCSDDIKNNKEVVLAAIKQNENALQYADVSLRNIV